MSTVETAERKSQLRAIFFFLFAGVLAVLMMFCLRHPGSDFVGGLWAGITLGAALNLTPLKRWLKPNSAVARLLDDESTREHRRISNAVGFWAALASALVMTSLARVDTNLSGLDVARVIATATVGAALIVFATLELRAGRG